MYTRLSVKVWVCGKNNSEYALNFLTCYLMYFLVSNNLLADVSKHVRKHQLFRLFYECQKSFTQSGCVYIFPVNSIHIMCFNVMCGITLTTSKWMWWQIFETFFLIQRENFIRCAYFIFIRINKITLYHLINIFRTVYTECVCVCFSLSIK